MSGIAEKNSIAKNIQLEENLEFVPENKKGFLTWVKTYKKQLILAGVSITTIVGIILGIKNKDVLVELWSSLAESIKKVPISESVSISTAQSSTAMSEPMTSVKSYTPPKKAVGVSGHIRTMSTGRHHSAEKAAEAAALGIPLLPNQTLVDPYTKYAA